MAQLTPPPPTALPAANDTNATEVSTVAKTA